VHLQIREGELQTTKEPGCPQPGRIRRLVGNCRSRITGRGRPGALIARDKEATIWSIPFPDWRMHAGGWHSRGRRIHSRGRLCGRVSPIPAFAGLGETGPHSTCPTTLNSGCESDSSDASRRGGLIAAGGQFVSGRTNSPPSRRRRTDALLHNLPRRFPARRLSFRAPRSPNSGGNGASALISAVRARYP
jgi:hypothetical protein